MRRHSRTALGTLRAFALEDHQVFDCGPRPRGAMPRRCQSIGLTECSQLAFAAFNASRRHCGLRCRCHLGFHSSVLQGKRSHQSSSSGPCLFRQSLVQKVFSLWSTSQLKAPLSVAETLRRHPSPGASDPCLTTPALPYETQAQRWLCMSY